MDGQKLAPGCFLEKDPNGIVLMNEMDKSEKNS